MQEKETSYEEQVMAWLRSKNGDICLAAGLAKKFKVGSASMLTLLNELVKAGKVRRSSSKRSIGFYIPSERMLAAERAIAQDSFQRSAHKIDRSRAELYARIDAQRAAIKSIG